MSNELPEWFLEQQVQERAYFLWLEAGCPNDNDIHFWLQAEKEIRSQYECH